MNDWLTGNAFRWELAKTDRRDFGRWSRALGSWRNGFELRRVFKGQATGGTQSETSSPAADSTAHELRRMWEDFDRIGPRHSERSDCREKSTSDWRDDSVVNAVKDALQRQRLPRVSVVQLTDRELQI